MNAAKTPLFVVKVGTNVITESNGFLNIGVLKELVTQIAELKKKGVNIILVSSGAMAAGRALLPQTDKTENVVKRQMLAAVGQAALMKEYSELFQHHGYLCAQVLTTKADFRTRQHYLNMQNCFTALLKDNVVPIVNENDVVSVEELMFTDNDELAGLISSLMDAEKLIILTSVDGVYDGPIGSGKVLTTIEPQSKLWKKHLQAGTSQFGKGGMHTKCAIAEKLAATGIAVHIVNGARSNVLLEIAAEKPIGTFFRPTKKASHLKRWVAHAEGLEKGKVTVNACAADILASTQVVSLLPVGITNIEGDFVAGDIIQICREDGVKIGLGKAQYDSEKAVAVIGKKGEKALIHYNYLYLL